MENDNLYPRQGEAFAPSAEPQAQKLERDEEINNTLQAIPRLKAEVERLDEKIAFYNSTTSITGEALLDKELFMHTYAAYQIVSQILDGERTEILARVEDVASNAK